MRVTRALAFSLALAVALIGVGIPPAALAQGQAVSISGYAFQPATLTITAGETVTWTNSDQAPHDVTTTSAPVAIHGSRMNKGQTWSYTFTTPGTYSYICSIHPDMKATVIVRPAATTARPPAPARTHLTTVAAPAAGPGMAMPAKHRVRHTKAAPKPTSPVTSPTSSAPVAVAAGPPSASSTPEQPLRPLLIVAGIVAAVATFCLLLLATRAEGTESPSR